MYLGGNKIRNDFPDNQVTEAADYKIFKFLFWWGDGWVNSAYREVYLRRIWSSMQRTSWFIPRVIWNFRHMLLIGSLNVNF